MLASEVKVGETPSSFMIIPENGTLAKCGIFCRISLTG